jgi:hypothetical protein
LTASTYKPTNRAGRSIPAKGNNMNARHLKFCRQHDWGKNAILTSDGRICGITNLENDIDEIQFSDFKQLLMWAGY